jgi:hypothetical protein
MTARASFLALFHYGFADFSDNWKSRRGFKLFCFWHAAGSLQEPDFSEKSDKE